jgi:hypothetical protein
MTCKLGRGAPTEVLRCAGAAAGFAIDEITQAATLSAIMLGPGFSKTRPVTGAILPSPRRRETDSDPQRPPPGIPTFAAISICARGRAGVLGRRQFFEIVLYIFAGHFPSIAQLPSDPNQVGCSIIVSLSHCGNRRTVMLSMTSKDIRSSPISSGPS